MKLFKAWTDRIMKLCGPHILQAWSTREQVCRTAEEIFHEIWQEGVLVKFVDEFHFSLKLGTIIVHFTQRPIQNIIVHFTQRPIQNIIAHFTQRPIQNIIVHFTQRPIQNTNR